MKDNKPNLGIKSELLSQNEEAKLNKFVDGDKNRNNKGKLFYP